jgi:hypothetical protein
MFQRWQDWFRNVPDDDEETAIEEIAQRVVREGMASAAIVFLESTKPVSFLAGQAAIFATPFVGGFIEPLRLERYADLFSRRDFVERLIRRIEELEDERLAGKSSPAGEKPTTDNN